MENFVPENEHLIKKLTLEEGLAGWDEHELSCVWATLFSFCKIMEQKQTVAYVRLA